METFSALLAFCAGNSPVTGEFPTQRPVTRSFDVSFDLCLKRLSKQSLCRWFETPTRSLWRHSNVHTWSSVFTWVAVTWPNDSEPAQALSPGRHTPNTWILTASVTTSRPRQIDRHFTDDIFNLQYSSIAFDNGLAPTRRQAMIWTNDG